MLNGKLRSRIMVGNKQVRKRYLGNRLIWAESVLQDTFKDCMYIVKGTTVELYPIFKKDIRLQNIDKLYIGNYSAKFEVTNFSNLKYIDNNANISFVVPADIAKKINSLGGVTGFEFWGWN